MEDEMSRNYTADELNSMSNKDLVLIILDQQERLQNLDASLERLIEQVRIANENLYGRKSEKLDVIDGQFSFFDEVEAFSDPHSEEPSVEQTVKAPARKKKKKGKRDADLEGLPTEEISHTVTEEQLNAHFGEGNWRKLPTEVYKRLRYVPASWTVEIHSVDVYVGTGGEHQDEFLRGNRPKDLLRNSIVTPSLGAAILNAKFVNALPINRISQEFDRNGLTISRQTMANWVIAFRKYFQPLWDRMKTHLLSLPVVQADETPTLVIHDGRPTPCNSYMWVHRSSEFCREMPIVLYEYQKTRHHDHPKEFYKDYHGILETDGLSQYHLLEKELSGLINANCWTHARRDFADACKAMDKKHVQEMRMSTAHQALELIAKIFHEEEKLKVLSADERLAQRIIKVKPLVEAYFAWVKEQLSSEKILQGKTMDGLKYSINQEKYLRVFLTDGNVPIDNSASERSIRPFCLGKKNWVLFNTIKGAQASAVVYSIAESAKANNLRPYMYFKHLLTVLPEHMDKEGYISTEVLDAAMPWSKTLPEECYKCH